MPTVFTKIINKEIPTKIIYEDELCLAFSDIKPQAPVHILLIPKKEIPSLDKITVADKELMGHLICKTAEIAKQQGLDKGYRMVVNVKDHGGQTVFHLHFHIIGGRQMSWPPG